MKSNFKTKYSQSILRFLLIANLCFIGLCAFGRESLSIDFESIYKEKQYFLDSLKNPSLGVGCAYVGVSAKFCFAKTAITAKLHKKKQKRTTYQIDNPAGSYYLTFQLIDWVDEFTRKIYRDIILQSLDHCRINKGLEVWAYVIMSNHVHCMLSAI